jgi:hypothetical protein
MKTIYDLGRSAQHPMWLRGIIPAAILTVLCIGVPQIARAGSITVYDLNVTAEVSSYCCAVLGDFITVTGQFQYDNGLEEVTSVALTVTGNLQGGALPPGGIFLDTAVTGGEDANDLFATGSNGAYALRFQFANSLSSDSTDPIAVQPWTDNGDAQFVDADDAYNTYHIGYFSTTGSAIAETPEPSSAILLGGSLLVLLFISRRTFTKRLTAEEKSL